MGALFICAAVFLILIVMAVRGWSQDGELKGIVYHSATVLWAKIVVAVSAVVAFAENAAPFLGLPEWAHILDRIPPGWGPWITLVIGVITLVARFRTL